MNERSWILDMKGFTDADKGCYARVLFGAFCLTVPTYAWLLFGFGVVPIWVYLPIMVAGPLGFIMAGLHLVVYGVILNFIARGSTEAIFYLVLKPSNRFLLLASILLGLAILALNPVYAPPPFGERWMNILRLATHFPFLR